jgi:hypothetical protein
MGALANTITSRLMAAESQSEVVDICAAYEEGHEGGVERVVCLSARFRAAWAGVLVPNFVFPRNLNMFLKGDPTCLLDLIGPVYAMKKLLSVNRVRCNAAVLPKHGRISTHCVRIDRLSLYNALCTRNPYFNITQQFIRRVVSSRDDDLFVKRRGQSCIV